MIDGWERGLVACVTVATTIGRRFVSQKGWARLNQFRGLATAAVASRMSPLMGTESVPMLMARSERAQEYVEWKEGAIVLASMLVAALLGGVGLYLLEIPLGWLIGAILGALIVFLGYSYLTYGRG